MQLKLKKIPRGWLNHDTGKSISRIDRYLPGVIRCYDIRGNLLHVTDDEYDCPEGTQFRTVSACQGWVQRLLLESAWEEIENPRRLALKSPPVYELTRWLGAR